MSERKRSRLPYSELSQEEKDRINARRRALQSRKKKQQMHALVPVYVQDGEMSTNSGNSSLTPQSSFQINITAPSTSNASTSIQASQTDSLEQQSNDGCSDFRMLYDVPIGITSGLLMPQPRLQQRPIPTEPYRLPEQPSCVPCHAKKFPYETARFYCCSLDKTIVDLVLENKMPTVEPKWS